MYHPLLDQGIDPDDHDNPDAWLTDEGECSECGYDFDLLDVPLCFVVEESGMSPDTPDGPAVHWAAGYLVCPQCKSELPYEVAS